MLDGITIADLYPVCVEEAGQSYDLEALEQTIDKSNADRVVGNLVGVK